MHKPAIDTAVFNKISELMDDSLGDFIETYLQNSPKLLQNINQALTEADLDSIFQNAHQLKGGSGSIGAMRVFQIAKQLEEDAREGSSEGLDDLFASLQSAYEKVAVELKTYL